MTLDRFRRDVHVADPEDSVAEVAVRMRDLGIGALIVVRGRHPIGIVTDRDLAVRVLAERRDPRATRVRDVVTWDPIVVGLGDGIETAVSRMRDHGVRRLPIVDADGDVVGIVTADDVMTLLGRELADLGEGIEASSDSLDSR